MPGRRLTAKEIVVVACSALVGLVAWWWAMASAPRESLTGETGNNLYWWVLVGVAAVAGWLIPGRAWLVAWALVGPGLFLAEFTAPRGDNDGLWRLVFFILAVWVLVLAGAAELSGRLRGLLSTREGFRNRGA